MIFCSITLVFGAGFLAIKSPMMQSICLIYFSTHLQGFCEDRTICGIFVFKFNLPGKPIGCMPFHIDN